MSCLIILELSVCHQWGRGRKYWKRDGVLVLKLVTEACDKRSEASAVLKEAEKLAEDAKIKHDLAFQTKAKRSRFSTLQSACVLYLVEDLLKKRKNGKRLNWTSVYDSEEGRTIMDFFFPESNSDSIRNHYRNWEDKGVAIRLRAEEYADKTEGTPLDWIKQIQEVLTSYSLFS